MATRRGFGEGNVRRLSRAGDKPAKPTGLWEARATLGYEDGKRIRRSFYGKTRAEVVAAMGDAMTKAREGTVAPSGALTAGMYLAGWLDRKEQDDLRRSTAIRYRSLIEDYAVPVIGKVKLTQLQPTHIERCMATVVAKECAPRTANHLRSALRAALSDAERQRLVTRNVAKLTKPRKVEEAHVEPITPEDGKAILAAVRGTALEPIVAVALLTGLRQGEVLGLRWRDIDRDFATLTVRGALHRLEGQWAWGQTKTESSRRTVAIPEPLIPVLTAHRDAQGTLPLPTDRPDGIPGDLVFTTDLGEPINGTGLTHKFRDALHRAGLPQRRFHDLRHGTATLLLASGVDIKTVSVILGHSTIAVTSNLYAKVLPSLHRDAAAKMAALMM